MQTLLRKEQEEGKKEKGREKEEEGNPFLSSEHNWDSYFSHSLSPDQVAYNSLPSCI